LVGRKRAASTQVHQLLTFCFKQRAQWVLLMAGHGNLLLLSIADSFLIINGDVQSK
jgi:hypothetical protein